MAFYTQIHQDIAALRAGETPASAKSVGDAASKPGAEGGETLGQMAFIRTSGIFGIYPLGLFEQVVLGGAVWVWVSLVVFARTRSARVGWTLSGAIPALISALAPYFWVVAVTA